MLRNFFAVTQDPPSNHPALKLHEIKGEQGAGQEKVHAENEGSPAVTVELGLVAAADRASEKALASLGKNIGKGTAAVSTIHNSSYQRTRRITLMSTSLWLFIPF